MSNKPMPLILGGTLGMIGAILAWDYALLGVPMIIVGGVLVFIAFNGSQKADRLHAPAEPPTSTSDTPHVVVNTIPDTRKMEKFNEQPSTKSMMRAVRHRLYNTGIAPQSPVILGDGDVPMLTVEQLLEELIVIAVAYKMPTDQVVGSIMKIYDQIFENVEEACRLYPNDMGYLTVWLAKKALTDIHPELEKQPEM